MELFELAKAQFPVITGKQIIIFIIIFAVCAGILGTCVYKQSLKGRQAVCLLAAFAFLYFILLSTVYSRTMIPKRICKLIPFWSYAYIWQNHSKSLAEEVFLNILMLVPAAILILVTVDNKKYLKWITAGAFFISTFIEVQQLVLQRGWFELDDIIHNTLGVWICCMLWKRLYIDKKMKNHNY